MKTKYLVSVLIASMALALAIPAFPVMAMWHPPSTCPVFGVDINGTIGVNGTDSSNPYVFAEPVDGFCENFNVTVWMYNAKDLYGYQFELWWNPVYFNLVSYNVNKLWTSQFQVKPIESGPSKYKNTVPFTAAVVAQAPSTGITGDFALVTFVFHINNDICWGDTPLQDLFYTWNTEVSNSCSQKIQPCTPQNAYIKFIPVQPMIYSLPKKPICSKIGTQFTESIYIENITKMKDFDITLSWSGYLHTQDPCGGNGYYTVLLTTATDGSDVVVNPLFSLDLAQSRPFDPSKDISVTSPDCGWYVSKSMVDASVEVKAAIDPTVTGPLNATHPGSSIWLFNVTFTQCDAWYCGAQPHYTDAGNHDWCVEWATTSITPTGTISTTCFGGYSYTIGSQIPIDTDKNYADGEHFVYKPIPGDLNGDGIVDIADLMIEAGYYGKPGYGQSGSCTPLPNEPPNGLSAYYDLNRDGFIDIFDMVIVAKNFGRTTASVCGS